MRTRTNRKETAVIRGPRPEQVRGRFDLQRIRVLASSTGGRAAGLYLVQLLLLLSFTHTYYLGYSGDTFTLDYDSIRVLHGQVPYRDFFDFPTPGTFWLQAVVFGLFGASTTNAQYLFSVVIAGMGVGIYLTSLSITGRTRLSVFAAVFPLLVPVAHNAFPLHHWYAACAEVLTALAAVKWIEVGRRRLLVITGIGCGCVYLFVQSDAILLFASLCIFLVIKGMNEAGSVSRASRRAGSWTAFLILGVAVVVVPVLVYFTLMGGLGDYIYDTLIWPPTHYQAAGVYNAVPFLFHINDFMFWPIPESAWLHGRSPIVSVVFYANLWALLWSVILPLLVYGMSLSLIWQRARAALRPLLHRRGTRIRDVSDADSDALLVLSLICLGLLAAMLSTGNRDVFHLDWISPITYPAFVAFAFGRTAPRKSGQRNDEAAAVLWRRICVSLLAAGLIVFGALTEAVARTPSSDAYFAGSPLVRYIRAHTAQGDTIAVFPFGGKSYMFGRPAALGYTLLWPGGHYNSIAQLRQAGDEMISHRPRLVIFGPAAGYDHNRPTDWSSYFPTSPRIMKFAWSYRFSGYVHVQVRDEPRATYRVYTREKA